MEMQSHIAAPENQRQIYFTNMKKPTCVSEIVPTAWAPAVLSNSTLILHARETSKFSRYEKNHRINEITG
jgi:hypothetical protein